MKSDRWTPVSERQLKRMDQLGVRNTPDLTIHRASQLINEAVARLRLVRGQRLSNLPSPPEAQPVEEQPTISSTPSPKENG